MNVTNRDINDNYARLINEEIQRKSDELREAKGLPKVDLSKDNPHNVGKYRDDRSTQTGTQST